VFKLDPRQAVVRAALEDGRDGTGLLENLLGAAQIAWALASPFLRGRRTRWGATGDDVRRTFPGDALVPRPRWQFLHAITVEAPPEAVWPWIAQVGQGRAGFYSFQILENLLGCAIENAGAIHPEWQPVEEGDLVRLHPKAPPLTVALVEPGRALVLHGDPAADPSPKAAPDVAISWAFVIEPLDSSRSRLYSRNRSAYGPGLVQELSYGPWLLEPISFVMDRKMLQGIRWRAERAHASGRG
jgi:hypothetical protein